MDPVLVGFSEQTPSRSVMQWAHAFADLAHAPLTMLSVEDDRSTERQPGEMDDQGLDLRRAALARALTDADIADTTYDVRIGDPLSTLADLADEQHASMVVVGTGEVAQGESIDGLAMRLLEHGHHTVAVVPDTFEPLEGGRFVVGIDGTKANGPALEMAAKLARSAHGSLTAVFAYDPLDDTFVLPEGWHRHSDDVRAELRRVRSVPIDLVMEPGAPEDVLCEVAEREHAAAIIVGTKGHHHALSRQRVGPVPVHLLHKGSCPTIAVPH